MTTATAPATSFQAPRSPLLESIELELLRESPLNTRKHFDAIKLEELKKSIEKSGILTPILVRPNPKLGNGKGVVFEIAAGHRRFRAGKMAGVAAAPCIVRDMDDATFLEVLTIENLQREDVHPLEEAQGYKNLLTLDGYDIKKIADRVGKSESYVYDRMKLLQLIKPAQKLFLENRFSAGHAILLARLSKADQERCLGVDDDPDSTELGGMWAPEGDSHPVLGLEDPSGIETEWHGRLKPVSVRQLQAWIDNHVRFTAPDPATPHLFTETTRNLETAQASKQKVIKISRDHMLKDDAKHPDGKRTYCVSSWTRADGQVETEDWWDEDEKKKAKPSQICEYSVLGVVVAGRGRGESFQVCIDKKRCMTHWGDVIRERNKREREREKEASKPASSSAKSSEPKEQPWEREQRLRAERTKRAKARWQRGGDAVLEAVAQHVKRLTVGGGAGPVMLYLIERIQDGVYGFRDSGKLAAKLGVPIGTTPADFLRHVVMLALLSEAEPADYNATNEEDLQQDLDQLKIKVNVKQLLDAANPEPKKEAKPKAEKKSAKKAKK